MKKLLLRLSCAAAALAAASSATAIAADLLPPPPLRPSIWTGAYIGGNIGYAFGGNDTVEVKSNTEGNVNDLGTLELEGFFGGGQIGYDWQMDSIVIGAVADIEASDIRDDFTKKFDINNNDDQIKARDSIDLWGTFRGRIGWAFDQLLVYGTGGLAWADVDYDLRANNFTSGQHGRIQGSDTRLGYAVGGGLEWAVADNWSLGAEYLYVNLGKYNLKSGVKDGNGDPVVGEVIKTEASPDFHSIKAFVNFRF